MSVRAAKRFGRYELLTELGRGGMAELHLARLSGIGGFSKLVAIKLMLPHLSQNKQFVDLFLNEGRIAARISHPNVCQVFEIGEEAGQLFLVMEYLEGVTWDELLREWPYDPVTMLRLTTALLAQACEGLQHAHDLRDINGGATPVIHRDISPQNLFVTVGGVCKVLDFGVAKVLDQTSHSRSGVLKGKVAYMSPEQAKGESLDTRSDIFSMGIVLWEALANRPLFAREAEFQTWRAVIEDEIGRISSVQPQFGSEVDAVVMRALRRDRELRQSSMRELAEDLRKLGDRFGGALTPAEISELVRIHCDHKLVARSLEIAAHEMLRAPPAQSSRDEPTVTDKPAFGSMALRRDSVMLGHEPKRRWWPLVTAFASFAIVATAGVILREDANRAVAPSIELPVGSVEAPSPPTVHVAKSQTVVAVTTKQTPKHRAELREPHRAGNDITVDRGTGTLSIDANPTARVYIDGVFVDETPLFQHQVSAGKHAVRLVNSDGQAKTMNVTIVSGELVNKGQIRW